MDKKRSEAIRNYVVSTRSYRDTLIKKYMRTNDPVTKDNVVVKIADIIDDLVSVIDSYEELTKLQKDLIDMKKD